MQSFRLNRRLVCPVCRKGADGASTEDMNARRVSPGDLSVCVYCASVNEYIYHDGEQALLLVPLSDEAIEALPANARKELHRARRVVAGVRLRGLPGDKKA